MRFLRTNTAVIVTVGPFYDKTDGVTIETALTITNERITLTADTDDGSAPTNILDNVTGATSGTSNDLNYITGNDAGMMQLELSAANVNRLGRMMLSITDAANHVPVFHEFMVVPALVYDTYFASSGGATFPAATLASTTNITAGTITTTTNLTNLPAITANWLTAAGIASGALNGKGDWNIGKTGYALSSAGIQALWDALTSALTTVGSVGKLIVDNLNATISSRASQTSVDTIDDFLDTEIAAILADTNELQTDWVDGGRLDLILDARASQTSVNTIDDFLDTEVAGIITTLGTPAGASIAADIAAIEAQTDDIGASGAGLTAVPWNAAWDAEVQSEVDDALVARNLDKLVLASGTADSGSTTTMVDAARTEADADYWKGRVILFTSGTITGQCAIITDFNAGTDTITFAPAVTQAVGTQTYVILPAISVWDDTLAEHLASGSTGNALNSAGSAGDPWTTALPGAYGAGTAGKIVGDNLNTTVSSRASQTSVDTIDDFLDTEIAAILADTNELQTDWVDGGRLDLILDARASQTSVNTIDDFLDTEVAGIITTLGTPAGASIAADIAAIEAQTDDIGASGAGLTGIPWNAAWDAEVQSEVQDALEANNLDHLVGTATGIPAIPAGTFIDQIMDDGTAAYDRTTDSLQAIRDRGDAAWTTGAAGANPAVLQNTTIATLASQTSFTLTAGSADNDAYNGHLIVVTDQTTAEQKAVGVVLDYVGSTKTVTLAADLAIFTMAVGDEVDVLVGKANMVAIDGALTNGNNATLNLKQLNIVNSAGTALVASSTGSSGHGILASGNANGEGISAQGGSADGSGIEAVGQGVGKGIMAYSPAGPGIQASGGTNAPGFDAVGAGSGAGIRSTGGPTGHGVSAVGGSSSGNGLNAAATAGNGHGVNIAGQGSGHGINVTGGATGNGIDANGGATSGDGINAAATTSGDGMELVGAGGGLDLNATTTDSLEVNATAGGGLTAQATRDAMKLAPTAGAAAGGSIDDLLATVETNTQNIETDTQDIQTRLPAALVSGRIDASVGTMQSGVVTAAAVATGAIDADALATDAVAEIADGVWDEARSGHTTAGTFGESFLGVVNGQAATGTLSTTQMTTNLTEATDDHYNGRIVVFITGVLAGQATDITDYTGATKLITMTALTEAPSNGDRFVIV